MIRTIPLDKLVPSPRNVRRGIDQQADLELKADIAARGLLQNLVVTGVRKPKGCFAVEAGERRRRALQGLADDGALPADFAVACLVVAGASDGREASLAENFQRLAMNPADECLAFQQLIEQGADVEGIARRFGLTTRFVDGRLRLAGLAPVVFEALGAGEIGLDVAKAYAATPDRDRQAWVFDQLGNGYSAHHPDSIRRMMTQATASAGDRRARLVGEEAYLAAGGRIESDLFADESAARWLDVALLERLAGDKMAALADEAKAETGLAFVRPTLDSWVGYGELDGLRRVPVDIPPLSDEEKLAVDALQQEIDGLADVLEDEEAEPDACAQAEAQIEELTARIEAIVDKPPLLDEALRAQVGTFLVLDDRGRPRLDRSYYSEVADEPADAQAANEPEAERRPGAVGKAPGLSQRLVDELAMQRRDVLAVHVAADPPLALDLAAFLMVDRQAGHWGENSGSSLSALPPADPVAGFRTPDAAATIARGQAGEALERSWTEAATRAERFDAFRALPEAARRPGSVTQSPRRSKRASTSSAAAPARSTTISDACSGSRSRAGGGRPAPTTSTASRRARRWPRSPTSAARRSPSATRSRRRPSWRSPASGYSPARSLPKPRSSRPRSPGCPRRCALPSPRNRRTNGRTTRILSR